MSYRDWARGEGSPREPISSWGDSGESVPDSGDDAGRYRTPSRRRAIERGQQEPVDAYLPRWAVESGVERADGGGRHAAPDEEPAPRPGRRRAAESPEGRRAAETLGGRRAAESPGGRRRARESTEPAEAGGSVGPSGSAEAAGTVWSSGSTEPAGTTWSPGSGSAGLEHTQEWTFDRPQQDGYVGSRRAEADEQKPVSGAPSRSRPRRSASRRPEVVWSTLEDTTSGTGPASGAGAGAEDRPAAEPTPSTPPSPGRGRRGRRASTPTWSDSAGQGWERSPDQSGVDQPPVDPWGGAGRQAGRRGREAGRRRQRAGEEPESTFGGQVDSTGQWDRIPAVDPWDTGGVGGRRTDDTDQWDRTDTGQWDRTDTGQWGRADADRWSRLPGPDPWEDTGVGLAPISDTGAPTSAGGAPVSGSEVPVSGVWDRDGRPEETGLSGGWSDGDRWSRGLGADDGRDDPRWTQPSTAAPQSPALGYSSSRWQVTGEDPALTGGRGTTGGRVASDHTSPGLRPTTGRTSVGRRSALDDTSLAPVSSVTRSSGAAAKRRTIAAPGSWSRRLEDDLLDPDPSGPFRPLVYTVACYLVPAFLVVLWLLTLDGAPPPDCVTDITGGGCASPRSQAFGSLGAGTPRFGLALASSLLVAEFLRRVGTTWRAATIALAAAVVGGGLSTVMISVVTGQPIG
ncbi:hypothetical protein [Micromonospora sp. SH-82]|uniref:hypothetical protein n=1 Tax=Micromonospora sp. SH-82 TaxID=3132938 RepID=UPI003EBF3059